MTPTHIIIHHSLTKDTGTVSWGAIRHYHKSYAYQGNIITKETADELIADGKTIKRPWLDIGYHVGIELVNEDYEILLGRMPNVRGAHCPPMNGKSIGICAIGNFDVAQPPREQWLLTLRVAHYFSKVYDIFPANVKGHRDYNPHKTCPGNFWDMDQFREDLSCL